MEGGEGREKRERERREEVERYLTFMSHAISVIADSLWARE